MKSKLLPLALLAASVTASAQNTPVLRAFSVYEANAFGNVQLLDSMKFVHLNNRNSTATPSRTQFRYPDNGMYADDTAYSADGDTRYHRKFNAAGLTAEHVEDQLGPAPYPERSKTVYSYNASLLPDTVTSYYNHMSNARTIYNYQGSALFVIKHQLWNGISAWVNVSLDSFAATGAAGSDSMSYSFNWTGTAYFEVSRHNYERDINNRVLVDSVFDSSAFRRAFYKEYDSQGRLASDSVIRWDVPTSSIVIASKLIYNYDAQGNLTSMNINWQDQNNNWMLIGVDSFAYNNHRQITRSATYDKNANGLSLRPGFYVQNFYYHDPVKVSEVATTNTLHLYPIPATSYINIKTSFTKPQPFSVRIFDMQGRLVSNWQEAAQSAYSKQLPILNFTPGQYTLHILAGEESASRQFSVIR